MTRTKSEPALIVALCVCWPLLPSCTEGSGEAHRRPPKRYPGEVEPRENTKNPRAARKAGSAGPVRPLISLSVSPQIASIFVPITEDRYTEMEVDALFRKMRMVGDPFCAMTWKKKKWNRELASKFIRSERVERYGCQVCRPGIIAGCWNYFAMNDRKPHQDFMLVKDLYGGDKVYDCYSVGFVQPYMMHSILGCKALTMLDLDWRILDGHFQLLTRFIDGELKDLAAVNRALSSLDVGWVAHSGPLKPRMLQDGSLFCKLYKQQSVCYKHLLSFQKRVRELREVRLNLSALHDASFDTLPDASLKVVFLSNAMEAYYTSFDEFERMLVRSAQALKVGQKMIFINHIAGYPAFGLYELTRTDEGLDFRTVCMDRRTIGGDRLRRFIHVQKYRPKGWGRYRRFRLAPGEKAPSSWEPPYYYTHFEVKLEDAYRAPNCSFLRHRLGKTRNRHLQRTSHLKAGRTGRAAGHTTGLRHEKARDVNSRQHPTL